MPPRWSIAAGLEFLGAPTLLQQGPTVHKKLISISLHGIQNVLLAHHVCQGLPLPESALGPFS
jgi:hypothetical protein